MYEYWYINEICMRYNVWHEMWCMRIFIYEENYVWDRMYDKLFMMYKICEIWDILCIWCNVYEKECMIHVWDMMNNDALYAMNGIMKYEEWCMVLYMIWEQLSKMITKPMWAEGTVMSKKNNTSTEK